MAKSIEIGIRIFPDGYYGVDITIPNDALAKVHGPKEDPGYETEPMKQRDDEDEGILYDNLD